MNKKILIATITFGLLLFSSCSTLISTDQPGERPPLINTNEFWNFTPYWDTNSVPDEHWDTNQPSLKMMGDYYESV